MHIHLQAFTGTAVLPYVDDLAKLRIEVFRDFPYLYEGKTSYEEAYLSKLTNVSDSVIVVAFDNNKVIGASTGIPLEQESANVQKPFVEKGYDITTIFYFGESVLQKAYRGRGIGVEFFKHREAHVRHLNRFEMLTFCSVIRAVEHPLRPAEYVPLDAFWQKRGFEPTELICHMHWQEVGETEESEKPLRFWWKRLF